MSYSQAKQTPWFGALVVAALVLTMTPAIVLAAGGRGGGFDAVVHGIESRYHHHATRIPFMRLISGIAGISTHGAVRNLRVAQFEHFLGDSGSEIDGDELKTIIEQRAGEGWERIIRETSRSGDEQSLIYARPDGQHISMLIVDLSGKELDVVQISVDADRLMQEIADHTTDRRDSGRHHLNSEQGMDSGTFPDVAHDGDATTVADHPDASN